MPLFHYIFVFKIRNLFTNHFSYDISIKEVEKNNNRSQSHCHANVCHHCEFDRYICKHVAQFITQLYREYYRLHSIKLYK